MLFTVQFPIADARTFVPRSPRRVERPDFTNPLEVETDFVRHFGPVRRRIRGGHVFWHDELFFCEANRAFGFVDSGAGPDGDSDGARYVRAAAEQCAFRRLFCDQSLA